MGLPVTWASSVSNFYATGNYNAAIGQAVADADLDNTAPVDETDGYCSTIDLVTYNGNLLLFKFDGNNGTDDLSLNLYRRYDTTWDNDEISIRPITVSSDGSEDIFSFNLSGKVYGPGYYRWAMQSSAGNTTFDMYLSGYYWI